MIVRTCLSGCVLFVSGLVFAAEAPTSYPTGQFLIATGQGDLTKGELTCRRGELAKQIRVLVQEKATDRVRERSGHPIEQDIEIVREEMARELLQDVTIVDRHINETTKTCSSTAIMPKSRIQPTSAAKDALP